MISIENFNVKEKTTLGIKFLDDDFCLVFSKLNVILKNLDRADINIGLLREDLDYLEEVCKSHFELEESYMRFSGKGSFIYHKHCHEMMKSLIIPALERPHTKSKLKEALGVFSGQLFAHMFFTDSLLKETSPSPLKEKERKDSHDLESSLIDILNNNMAVKAEMIDQKLHLDKSDELFCYERIYNLNDTERVRITAAIDELIIFAFLDDIFGIRKERMDEFATAFTYELTKAFGQYLVSFFKIDSVYESESEEIIDKETFFERYNKELPCTVSFAANIGDAVLLTEKL